MGESNMGGKDGRASSTALPMGMGEERRVGRTRSSRLMVQVREAPESTHHSLEG